MTILTFNRTHLVAVEREACRNSFFEFLQSFWSVIIKEDPIYNWHIEYLCNELQIVGLQIVRRLPKLYDLIINIPPGTTKSTITTIMFPAWLWVRDPTIRIISNSYSGDLSWEHSGKSRDIITSFKYQRLFPEVQIRRDKSGRTGYENTQTGARYTTSTGATILGKHAHVILNDDPVNPYQALSPTQRESANEHTKTLSTRKVNKDITPVITIMQRLHERDVTGFLMEKKGDKIKQVCLPAEETDKVKPAELKRFYVNGLLDPLRLNRTVLEESKIDLGTRGYTGQFLQSPTSEAGNIIKKEWFRKISPEQLRTIKGIEPIIFFVDTAYTDKTENDPTGIIATIKIRNFLYILNAVTVRYRFPELIRFLPEYVKANGYTTASIIFVEPKANGISVIDSLTDLTGLNITQTPTPKDSKETRLNAKSPKIESGRVFLVDDFWNDDFIEEICGFPNKSHDEFVDLVCYAIDYHLDNESNAQNLSKYF